MVQIETYAKSDKHHMFALFPEGGLVNNPKLRERTIRKNKEYGTNLQYLHFPKTSGFSQLIQIVGNKIQNVYTFILVYNVTKQKLLGNKVDVIVKKVAKISDIPKEPSKEYVEKYKLVITDDNRLFYAHEEFLLKWTIETDKSLSICYSSLNPEDRPTISNIFNKTFPYEEEDSEDEDEDNK
jgi:hypothetical protein